MTGDDDSVKSSPFTLTPTLSPFGKLRAGFVAPLLRMTFWC